MFAESPTEQTTAITDLFLSLQAIGAIWVLNKNLVKRPVWTDLWTWFFGLLSAASLLGAISHGIKMTSSVNTALWVVIYLALGIMMALFLIAAVTLHWSPQLGKRCLPYGIVIAFAFFVVTQIWSDSFLLFVIYEAISLLLALTLYLSCFWIRRAKGSGWLAAGIVVGIVAATLDAQPSIQLNFIWTFNNHGVFHLVQMISLLLLSIGVCSTHQPTIDGQAEPAKR